MTADEVREHIDQLLSAVKALPPDRSEEDVAPLTPIFIKILTSVQKSPHIPLSQRIELLSLFTMAFGEVANKLRLLRLDFFLDFLTIDHIGHLYALILLSCEVVISALADLPESPERDSHVHRLIDLTIELQKELLEAARFIDEKTAH